MDDGGHKVRIREEIGIGVQGSVQVAYLNCMAVRIESKVKASLSELDELNQARRKTTRE